MRKTFRLIVLIALAVSILAAAPVAYAFGRVACHPGDVFTVTFDTSGGSAVAAVNVTYGGKIPKPGDPVLEGYTFDGWYSDEDCTCEWDFNNDTVMDNTTLYAGWDDGSGDADDPAEDGGDIECPDNLAAESDSYKSIALSWEGSGNEDGFEVYRANTANGEYALVDTAEEEGYVDSGLVTNTTYYYKVRAFSGSDEDVLYSDFTDVVSAKPVPSAPEVSVLKTGGKKVKISWSKVSGAKKYEVYSATSQNGKYKMISGTATKSYTQNGAVKGKTYYYKVRATCTVKGKKVYGAFSEIVSVSFK